MYVVSVGTGKVVKKYEYDKVKKWGLLQWIKPVIDMMMSSSVEVINYQVKKLFEAIKCPTCYVRMEPDLGKASPDMDNVSNRNISNLINAGLAFIDKNEKLLNEIVDELIKNT